MQGGRAPGLLTQLCLADKIMDAHSFDVAYWPEASVSCVAAIRPESGVKPTCRDRSTDAVDP